MFRATIVVIVSVAVSLERLADAIAQFGPTPFLLTVSDDGRPHAVGVVAAWDDEALRAAVGSGSAANAEARPLVSLVWPPFEEGGYSLIVDGDAQVVSGVEGLAVLILPTKAVLHRAAAPGTGAASGACSSDCLPLSATPPGPA
jgi:hypothetical protein